MTRGVYLIRHEPSGRCYVGGSTDIEQRWRGHRYSLSRGTHPVAALQSDWERDGDNAFTWEVIERVPHYGSNAPPFCYAIDFAEQRWIDQLTREATALYNGELRVVSRSRMATESLLGFDRG